MSHQLAIVRNADISAARMTVGPSDLISVSILLTLHQWPLKYLFKTDKVSWTVSASILQAVGIWVPRYNDIIPKSLDLSQLEMTAKPNVPVARARPISEETARCLAKALDDDLIQTFLRHFAVSWSSIREDFPADACLTISNRAGTQRVTLKWVCTQSCSDAIDGHHERQCGASRFHVLANGTLRNFDEIVAFLRYYTETSHLCGSTCYTPHHVVPEPHATNISRTACHTQRCEDDCPHNPQCFMPSMTLIGRSYRTTVNRGLSVNLVVDFTDLPSFSIDHMRHTLREFFTDVPFVQGAASAARLGGNSLVERNAPLGGRTVVPPSSGSESDSEYQDAKPLQKVANVIR